MKNKVYCEHCKKKVNYHVVREKRVVNIDDSTYDLLSDNAICDVCNNDVYELESAVYNFKQIGNLINKRTNVPAFWDDEGNSLIYGGDSNGSI